MTGGGLHSLARRGGALFLIFLALGYAFPAHAGERRLQSRLITVVYEDEEDLKRFERQVVPSALARTLDSIFIGDNEKKPDDLAAFLDNIFIRVQKILDMPLKGLRLTIRIYKDKDEVQKVFRSMGTVSGMANHYNHDLDNLPAFYDHKSQTIYLQADDIDIGVLAHEMGHCVTSNYFVIKPPPTVAELMSQYVERAMRKEKY